MKNAGKKSSTVLKEVNSDIGSEIDAIVDHVEKNENCEFVRILEQYYKMNEVDRKKLMEYAEKL